MSVLAIDQGTTSTLALLVHPDGRTETVARHTHRQHHPAPGRVEHDPLELLDGLRACLDAVSGRDDVTAVALANQGESCLAWEATTGRPLSPVLVWQDTRAEAPVEALRRQGHEPLVRARAGLPLDSYFSAPKLAWLLRDLPEVERARRAGTLRLGTTDAWFRDRLTGRFETDAATASRTSLMTLERGDWDDDLCALFEVPRDCLPAIGPCDGDLGAIAVGARSLPLMASIVDQQAALYGHGCRAPGEAKITFGTGAFALGIADGAADGADDGLLRTVAWRRDGQDPVFAREGGILTASASLNWLTGLGLFDRDAPGFDPDGPSAASRGLVFVPALAGLGAPHWDRAARGAFLGLGLDTGRADMARAVMEGIALRAAEIVDRLSPPGPEDAPLLSVDGGLTGSAAFCRILCDALGREISVSAQPEMTALGAAALAFDAAGIALHPPAPPVRLTPRRDRSADRETFRSAISAIRSFAGRG